MHPRITKGDSILIPVGSIDRDPGIWGEDADEFRYESLKLIKEYDLIDSW